MRFDSSQENLIHKSLLSPQEMARYLNVSLKTIYRLVEGRAIPFYKIGRGLRFKREDIDEYMKNALVESIPK
jgi:excisionase family DNA binding protein